jgi:uncharacterized protein (TIGR03083 family)
MEHPDVRDVLPRERDALLELLAGLDDREWEAPTECPAWTVKGIALHVLGDDLSLLSRQRDAAPPGLLVYAEDHPGLDFRGLLDGFNEQWVEAARFLSAALVVELLRLTGDWTAAFYAGVDPSAPGEPVGFFASAGPSPYWQISAREYVERWVHHQQIRRAVARPDLGEELLVPALDVVVHGLAAHLPDLGGAPGTGIALTVTDLGSWVLRREPEGWAVCRGGAADPEPAPAAELRLERSLAVPVFSRGLTGADVGAAFAVTGDAALGFAALAALVRLIGG